MILTVGEIPTPIGSLLLAVDGAGALRAAEWTDGVARLHRHARAAGYQLVPGDAPAMMQAALRDYFAGQWAALLRLEVRASGTPFQHRVWQALRQIPPGQPMRYAALGHSLGLPDHARAIGHANAANPVNLVIPCHRLTGAGGALTGYAGGLARKHWLLAHEGGLVTAPYPSPPPGPRLGP